MLTALDAMLTQYVDGLNLNACDVGNLGGQIGLDHDEAVRLFRRLVGEGYLRAQQHAVTSDDPFGYYFVEDLTDKGLRAIQQLPPEDSIDGITAVLEEYMQKIETDPQLTPTEKAQKRGAVQTVAQSIRAFAIEIGPKVAAEMLARGLFGL
jgi:hypothetical protein